MTFGRTPTDRSASTGFGPGPGVGPNLDAPYTSDLPDGFGGHGRPVAPDGFGPLAGTTAPSTTSPRATATAGQHVGAGTVPDAAAQAPRTAVPDTRLAAPPQIDFGEVVVGEHPTEAGYIFNLHPSHEAFIHVSLTGDDDFALMAAPDRLRPSGEGLGAPVTMMYQPRKRDESKATLKVDASWQMGVWPATTLEIPVVGKAYAPGEPTHAEEAAARTADAATRGKVAADQRRETALEQRTIRDNRITEPYPQGAMNDFDAAFEDAKVALDLVTDEQANGVDQAGNEAAAYRRAIPTHDPDLLFSLAMFGIDMATAGIAGSLAARLGARVSQKVTVGPRAEDFGGAAIWTGSREQALNPPEAVALVVESFKQGLKDAGKSGRKAAFAGDHGGGDAGAASGARIEFFSGQRSVLARSKAARGHALNEAMRHLRPLLRSAPDQATAALRAIREELDAAASAAKDEQAIGSRVAWMRFLSQNALGSLDPKEAMGLGLRPGGDGASITDTRGAIAPPREGEAMRDFDGVLTIKFMADYGHPEEPVTVQRARMTGVHQQMLKKLKDKSPRDLHIVVRAYGAAPGFAVLPITVVRDEAGNVRFTDDTGTPGQASSWLSRKGGSLHTSPERQRLGAIKLMDELIDRPLAELGTLEADHDGT